MERKIESITRIGNSISVIFNDGESVVFYPFGKTIITNVSYGVLKSTLSELKKDILKSNWNVQQLKEWYVPNR